MRMFSGKTRYLLCGLVLLLLLCAAVSACADDVLFPLPLEHATEVDREELGVKKGTKFPVYGAPFDDAWRGAKGKAAVSVAEPFGVLGSAQDDRWLMITYSVDKGSSRVGWIRTPDTLSEEFNCRLAFRLPYRVTRDTVLTDDPAQSRREIGKLREGDLVIAMLKLSAGGTDWIYAETEIDGKPVWAFIDSGDLLSVPAWTLENGTLSFLEGVSRIGLSDEDPTSVAKGEIWSTAIDFYQDCVTAVREIVLPSTLRRLDAEALYNARGVTLRLPGSVEEVSDSAIYSGYYKRIVLGKDYTGEVIGGDYWILDAWEVEPGNPRYSSRDGVLFSADGKTLLSYPNGRKDTHYDVPAGTEEIADMAFYDNDNTYVLQTVSLPIGLKRIGSLAFCGCGRLNSMTVPLTVTDLAEDAFAYCVSLERLSLPPGLQASFSDAALKEDFSRFAGDNGSTLLTPRDRYGDDSDDKTAGRAYLVWVSGENGEGPVKVYPSADAADPSGQIESGTGKTVVQVSAGRGRIGYNGNEEEWIDLADTLPAGYATFFDPDEVEPVPTKEGLAELARKDMAEYRSAWFYTDGMTAWFTLTSSESYGDVPDVDLPLNLVTLYRQDGDAGRVLGFLYAPERGEPIRICDAPGGSPVAWTYRTEEAEVLEQDGGWLRIRTASAEGWIPEDRLVVVLPKPSEGS